MTFTKEQISSAFVEVLNERVPDLSDIPDHVFSERFENNMDKLIRKEAAHPWAVSHTAAKNLLIAAVIAVLLLLLSISVSGIREPIFNFFTRHFKDHDDIVFNNSGRTEIDYIYEITAFPEGFELIQVKDEIIIRSSKYMNKNGDSISLIQKIPSDAGVSVDHEDSEIKYVEIEDKIIVVQLVNDSITLIWEYDGYEFCLNTQIKGFTLEQAIQLYSSIK